MPIYTIIQDGEEQLTCGSLHSLAEWVYRLGGVYAVEVQPELPEEHQELLVAMIEDRECRAKA